MPIRLLAVLKTQKGALSSTREILSKGERAREE